MKINKDEKFKFPHFTTVNKKIKKNPFHLEWHLNLRSGGTRTRVGERVIVIPIYSLKYFTFLWIIHLFLFFFKKKRMRELMNWWYLKNCAYHPHNQPANQLKRLSLARKLLNPNGKKIFTFLHDRKNYKNCPYK